MENQLVQQNNTLQNSLELNSKEFELTGIIYHVNQLTSFPLSSIQIQDWAITINDFYPNLDLDILKKIIRKYKVGQYKWNYREGIQNICEMLTQLGIEDKYTKQEVEEFERVKSEFYGPIKY